MKRVRRVKVLVPATSANLGPGYDVLGLALKLFNELAVQIQDKGPDRITLQGEGRDVLPKDAGNLVCQTMRRVFERYPKQAPVSVKVHMINNIPLARGLGSSAAARVAGLLAGNRLCGDPLNLEEVAHWAAELEGHPDNVVPAVFGGLCASALARNTIRWFQWDVPKEIVAVVCVPNLVLSTEKARMVLPHSVTLPEAVYNMSRVSLLIGGLTKKRFDLLRDAMNDRLHEPFRQHLVPGMSEVKSAALAAGAWGCALSGAGSSMIALAKPGAASTAVSKAMEKAFQKAGLSAKSRVLSVLNEGAKIN